MSRREDPIAKLKRLAEEHKKSAKGGLPISIEEFVSILKANGFSVTNRRGAAEDFKPGKVITYQNEKYKIVASKLQPDKKPEIRKAEQFNRQGELFGRDYRPQKGKPFLLVMVPLDPQLTTAKKPREPEPKVIAVSTAAEVPIKKSSLRQAQAGYGRGKHPITDLVTQKGSLAERRVQDLHSKNDSSRPSEETSHQERGDFLKQEVTLPSARSPRNPIVEDNKNRNSRDLDKIDQEDIAFIRHVLKHERFLQKHIK